MRAIRLHARLEWRRKLKKKGWKTAKPKPLPPEVAMALQWDVTTPLRPWEWWQVDAEEWTFAQEVHAAYREGVEDAKSEPDG